MLSEGLFGLSWPYVVLIAYLVPECISLLAKWLQRTKIGSELPKELKGIYDDEEYKTSQAYTLAKSNLSFVQVVYVNVIFLTFWFMGGFALVDGMVMRIFEGKVARGVVYMLLLQVGLTILTLPFTVYSTFVIEERFGFNKTTALMFVKDCVKAVVLVFLFGVPLLGVVLWFLEYLGPNAWLYVFSVVTAFQLVLLFLMPVIILPLFMEMIPLPEGLAFITEEQDKKGRERRLTDGAESNSLDFLYCRVFYGGDVDCNGRQCWITKDRRFKGMRAGGSLCLHWADDKGCWAISEGTPEKIEKHYAFSDSEMCPANGHDTHFQWRLNDEGVGQLLPTMIKFSRVNIGALRENLLALADRTGYKGASIFVIDGSSRSAHSNAFCTGFGKFRRICLFDTLLNTMTEHEILAVLGHEIGHDRLYHVHKMLVIQIGYTFIMFFALGSFLNSKIIAQAFFVPEPKVYIGFILFSICWDVVDFFVHIPMVIFQRTNEYEADRFSVECDISYAQQLKQALKKLTKRSKSNLTPHWFSVFLTYSHPPLDHRIEAIDAWYENIWQK